jgi:hypothetical protein
MLMIPLLTGFVTASSFIIYLYREEISKKILSGIDLYYDFKYSLQDSKIELAPRLPAEIVEQHADYIVYKWCNGNKYITFDNQVPILEDELCDDEESVTVYVTFNDGTTINGDNEDINELMRMVSGPGNDFSVTDKPNREQIVKLLNLDDVADIYMKNALGLFYDF